MIEGYDFKEKNQWRKWVWKEVKHRLPQSPKRSVILYLAGTEDLDRGVAKIRKFRGNNLIAVEKDKQAVMELRKKRVNVIHGDLTTTVANWSNHPLIDSVVADFCGGIDWSAILFSKILFHSRGLTKGCVIAANFQRGRDLHVKGATGRKIFDTDNLFYFGKNRAKLFEFLITNCITKYIEDKQKVDSDTAVELAIRIFEEKCKPVFRSYKSERGMYFDSIIFNMAGPNIPLAKMKENKSYKAKIAAAKAIRTMRMAA